MYLHNSFEFVAYSYSNEYQFHTIIFNMYHTDIGEILWKLIHRIWNYNFDDIYIYYSTKESIYQYLLPSSSLFSILDVIRQYHISIACNSYPFAYFHPMNTQFYTINFNKRRKWDISQKPIRSEFENMISMISIFSTKEFYHCRHRLYSRFHASHHVDGNTVEITVVQGLANRSKRSDGERIVQGTRSKANPIPTKRFEANRELKSRDFRTRLEFKRGIERISFFHHVFPTVENSTVLFLSGIMREPSCFPSSLLLEKVSPREIKLRNALPFAAQSSRPRFARAIWLSSVEYRISWKGFHPDPNLIERKK